MCVFFSQLAKLGLMASVWYESRIWGRRRTTGAFQSSSWTKVFPSAFHRAVQKARFSEWGPPPWAFWAQLLVVLSGTPWQFIARVLWGDVPKHEVQMCDAELWCVCSRFQMGLDQAILWQSTIPVESLTACDYTFIWDSCLLSHPLTCAIPPASGEQIKDIRGSLD